MVQIKVSKQWQKGKEFKTPFYYLVGTGALTEEEAEAYDGDGQLLFIKRLDMGDLLEMGIANDMDFMSKALMQTDEDKPKPESEQPGNAKEAVENVIKNAKNFKNMEGMVGLVCIGGIIEPKVYEKPEHDKARQKGFMYVDEIPWDDRMELFSVIFESEGLSTFREEQTDSVGDLADVPSVSLPADGSVALRSDDTEGVLLQSGSVPFREASGVEDERSGGELPEKQEAGAGS